MKTSLRTQWLASFDKDDEVFFAEYPKKQAPDRLSTINTEGKMPTGMVDSEVGYALALLCTGRPPSVHLDVAIATAECILSQKLYDGTQHDYREKKAKLLIDYACAKLLKNKPLDLDLLRDAPPLLAQFFNDQKFPRGDYADMVQGALLRSVRVDLICGNTERAKQWLADPRGFRYYKEEWRCLKKLADSPTALVSEAGLDLFERIRTPIWGDGPKPTHAHTCGRIEWAILILQRSGREVTGKNVVSLISE